MPHPTAPATPTAATAGASEAARPRYWVPTGTDARTDGAYLVDSDTAWGRLANDHLAQLEALADAPCLVLLGAPGAGKSTELQRAAVAAAEDGEALLVDLGDIGSEAALDRLLFEHPAVQSWRGGTHRLTLFLDSLDEGLLAVETLARRVAAELRGLDHARLALRVACRPGEWPASLGRVPCGAAVIRAPRRRGERRASGG